MNKYEIARQTDENAIEKIAFSSLDTSTKEGKKRLYNATNKPDYTISDFINKEIVIADIYIDVNERMIKDDFGNPTGEIEPKPRTVLFDPDGKTYIAGVSVGIFNSVKEIIRIFGTPDEWEEPITVVVKQTSTKRGNMLSLEIK